MSMEDRDRLQTLLEPAHRIVIVQADNPDGDSLASALALEQIFGDMGKEPHLYCGVDMPSYLHYLPGWDRVSNELPTTFDLSIIVDNSAGSLLETADRGGQKNWLATRPCIVIDHHPVDISIPFATLVINQPAVATGEIIYELAQQCKWPLNSVAKDMLAVSIMSDSLGLVSEGTTARSIHIVAELVEGGVSLALLDNARKELMRKSPELVRYKGELLQRVEYHDNDRIATITIPWEEIEKYSHAYNPSMLVLDDMRLTEGTDVAIAFKLYKDNKVTAKIRCNYGKTIATDLAVHFGGGGHPYASGFKVADGRTFEEIKADCIRFATELLNKLGEEALNETV
ncbi:MAG TPA: DHH family phosphoesterase [Patescibacteria group bacterium]|nr:DHH family phosphoesterase [Patescibacteria group bacterium]